MTRSGFSSGAHVLCCAVVCLALRVVCVWKAIWSMKLLIPPPPPWCLWCARSFSLMGFKLNKLDRFWPARGQVHADLVDLVSDEIHILWTLAYSQMQKL